jgi:hypothetical protein
MVVWLPLESNPDVINKFLVDLGVSPEYQVGWRACAGTPHHQQLTLWCFGASLSF